MVSGSPQQMLPARERHSRWLVACFALSLLCLGCLLVTLGIVWFGRNRLPLIRDWLSTITPTSTVTYAERPTRTHTSISTSTSTPAPTRTPTPSNTPTTTNIPTTRPTLTSTLKPEPSAIAGESPFLPPQDFPECTSPRTDNFIAGSDFSTFSDSYGTGEIVSGEYRMTMEQSNIWAWATDGFESGDAIYEVDVEQTINGSGAYGLIFGADSIVDTKSFYAFVIDSNTNFAVFRHTTSDNWETVLDWRSSPLLYSGGALNHIVAIRSGPMIALFANGFVLTSAFLDDNIQGSNYAGIIAWSNATPGLQATFDNYSVCPLSKLYPMPVYVSLEDTFRVPADQPVVLHMGWLAATRSQANSFTDLAVFSLTIDGREYSGFQEYWGPVLPFAGGYGLEWNLPLAFLSPGVHRIEYSLRLTKQITDGFDLDNNGKLDQYGPGEVFNGWVEIIPFR